jgi:cephalosporin-C deacetylase-like acetyl esterase
VLCPHGHWTYGRLENTELNSGPARAANFARQGYVAFAYDMVGYNDSAAVSHRYGGERESLWGLSLLGLQLWNSIRSVDFLLSLPEVDPERLGCTGESGGGTQTFLLAAVDERIKVAAPVNMISAHMQGGERERAESED